LAAGDRRRGGKEVWELHKAHLDAQWLVDPRFRLVIASLSAFAAIWACCGFSNDFRLALCRLPGRDGVVLLACVFFGWLPN